MQPYAELAGQARALLPSATWEYFAGGSGDGSDVERAAAAWAALRLRPRVLRDVSRVTTTTTVLGTPVALPVLVAPMAAHGLLHRDGEVATASGARTAGSLLVLSTRSSRLLPDVAAAAGPWWQQVYVMRDRGLSDEVARRAAGCGARALVLTVDTPYVAYRAGGRHPPPHEFAHLLPELAAASPERTLQAPDVTAADLARLHELSGLPVVAKGVLRGDEARRCIAAGAAAVVVSAHGGRQLPGVAAPADVLAEVVAAVGDTAEVYVDGGVRTAVDVLRALAVGAGAVLVGRPVAWALARGGSGGVRELLDDLHAELAEALALAGCASVGEADPDLVWREPVARHTVGA